MCEFLIKARDASNHDPTKDARGCYKRGDIVDVQANGFQWGTEESLPRFVVVQVTDLGVARARQLISPDVDATDPLNRIIRRRRLYNVVMAELPAGVRNQLATTGRYVTTLSAIQTFVRNTLADTRGVPQ